MGSQTKKIKRKIATDKKLIETMLFGGRAAPTDECEAERKNLIAQFQAALREVGTTNAPRFHAYLREAQAAYNRELDGFSPLMDLLDNVDALRAVEGEERKAAK